HVSALMSGVMIKLGVYGLLRASFVWLAPALPWWGATLLLVGAVSAVTGVLYAIVDRDLKRLLAFSSIENVGIVLVGTGAAVAIAGLALAAGLAVAAFVKAFGITFLALPRSDAAAGAHEAPVPMRVAMVATAAACAGLALGASAIVPALAAVAATLVPAPAPITVGAWLTLNISGDFASLSMPAVALALAGGILLPVLLLVVARARPRVRRYETWGCGRLLQTARMEYTATAFADPFTRVFDFFYRPAARLDV